MARLEEDESSRGDLTSIVSTETATNITVDDVSVFTSSEAPTSPKYEDSNAPPEKEPRFCRTGYCRNVRVFVACISMVFVLRGAVLSYSEDVVQQIGRRYPITATELNFIVGCERIGFVCTLLFVSFFGNRINKPVAITIGVFICAFGAILVAVPFFITGPRLYDTQISNFVKAGLCKQIHRNVSFLTQCDLIPYKGEKGGPSFSLIATAKVLIGLGSALFASLGLIYIDEGSQTIHVPIYLGVVMAMHAFGRFLGTLLAVWFTSLPEAINPEGNDRLKQTFAVYAQEKVGRWWLGYPVFASLFIVVAFFMIWFPKYIIVPDWVIRQRAKKAELNAERERRRKLRVQASKKRNSSNADGSRRKDMANGKSRHKSGNTTENGGRKLRSKNNPDRHSESGKYQKKRKSPRNRMSDDFGRQEVTIDDISGGAGIEADVIPLGDSDQAFGKVDRGSKASLNEKRHSKSERDSQRKSDLSSDIDYAVTDNSREAITNISEVNEDDTHGKSWSLSHDNTAFSADEVQGSDVDSLDVNMEALNEEERHRDFLDADGKSVVRHRRRQRHSMAVEGKAAARGGHASGSAAGREESKSNASRSTRGQAPARRRKRIRALRTEKLEDLPRSLLNILKNLMVLVVMLGAILGGFLLSGYLAILPNYIHVQFARPWTTAVLLTGVAGPLAWTVGALIGAVVMYKLTQRPLMYAALVIVSCLAISAGLMTILMAFHCQHGTTVDLTSKNLTACTINCECESIKVQYEPLCGADGLTYPSPCHAGCERISRTDERGVFNFSRCACVPGQHAVQGICTPACGQLSAFVIFTFVAVATASVGIVPIFVILLRHVRSRNRSLAVGFVIWAVYILAQTTGPVVFAYVRDGRCLHWGEDCLGERICWRYNLPIYRYAFNGTAAAFLVAAIIPFLLVLWRLRPQKSAASDKDKNLNDVSTIEETISSSSRRDAASPFVVHVNELGSSAKPGAVSRNGVASSPL